MFEGYSGAILGLATFGLMAALFIVNAFYQKRARQSADEMLRGHPEEYNKQIRANAFICLIRRGVVGLWMLSGSVYWITTYQTINYYLAVFLTLGVLFIAWGVYGFQKEKKRLIFLD